MTRKYNIALANVQACELYSTLTGIEMDSSYKDFLNDLRIRLQMLKIKLTEMEKENDVCIDTVRP